MNSKDLVSRALHGEKTERVPAGYHGWGMYKFALEGILEDYSLEKEVWKICGEELAGVEISAQELFDPDFIQVAEAFFEYSYANSFQFSMMFLKNQAVCGNQVDH